MSENPGQEQLQNIQREQENIRVELADEGRQVDPVSSVKNAQFNNLADAYRFQAEILDELRGQLQGQKDLSELQKQRLEELAASINEWKAFQQGERDRVQDTKPPIENTPLTPTQGKPFSPMGF